MLAPIVPLLKTASAVTAIVSQRIYRHGRAPQNVQAPYVTVIDASIVPQNALDEVPRTDNNLVQVSCWSNNTGTGDAEVVTLATAVRDAIEPHHHIVSMRDMGQDATTGRYRIDLDVSVWNDRA